MVHQSLRPLLLPQKSSEKRKCDWGRLHLRPPPPPLLAVHLIIANFMQSANG